MELVLNKLYMNIQQWWSDIYKGKRKYSQKNLIQSVACSFDVSYIKIEK
jgi:hypothetical protein